MHYDFCKDKENPVFLQVRDNEKGIEAEYYLDFPLLDVVLYLSFYAHTGNAIESLNPFRLAFRNNLGMERGLTVMENVDLERAIVVVQISFILLFYYIDGFM